MQREKIKLRSGLRGEKKGRGRLGMQRKIIEFRLGLRGEKKVLSSAAANRKKASSAVKALRQREVGFSG